VQKRTAAPVATPAQHPPSLAIWATLKALQVLSNAVTGLVSGYATNQDFTQYCTGL